MLRKILDGIRTAVLLIGFIVVYPVVVLLSYVIDYLDHRLYDS